MSPDVYPADLERSLHAWHPRARLDARLSGGYRNEIWRVQLHGHRLAARFSRRDPAALRWEVALLDYLDGAGFRVPRAVPSAAGETSIDGLVVVTWLEGEPPRDDEDWRRVVETLRRLHAATTGWPQRPGFHSTRELLTERTGGDVQLDRMPEAAREAVRDAWRAIADEPVSVVHGDPGAGNIRIDRGRVGLIDWDESRVDASILDLTAVPLQLDMDTDFGGERLRLARRASDAWEAANGWTIEPEYARRRLRQLIDAASTTDD